MLKPSRVIADAGRAGRQTREGTEPAGTGALSRRPRLRQCGSALGPRLNSLAWRPKRDPRRKALLDDLAAAAGHVLGVAQALMASLVGPFAEGLVLAPRPRQKRPEEKAGRQADQATTIGFCAT